MWFTFVTARLFFFVSFQPRLAAVLLTSCSVVNSPTQRVGLSPTFRPVSLAQHSRRLAQIRVPFSLLFSVVFASLRFDPSQPPPSSALDVRLLEVGSSSFPVL